MTVKHEELLMELDRLMYQYETCGVDEVTLEVVILYVEMMIDKLPYEALQLRERVANMDAVHSVFHIVTPIRNNMQYVYNFSIEMRGVHSHDYVQVSRRLNKFNEDGTFSSDFVKTKFGRVKAVNNDIRFLGKLTEVELEMLVDSDYEYIHSKF